MSGKSKHGRGKGSLQSKKKRTLRRGNQQVAVARPKAFTAPQNIARSDRQTIAPPEATAAPMNLAAVSAVGFDYPELPYELRRIGILAGIILATLVLLALILS